MVILVFGMNRGVGFGCIGEIIQATNPSIVIVVTLYVGMNASVA